MADCQKHFKCVSKDDFKPLTSTIALGVIGGVIMLSELIAAAFGGHTIPGVGVVGGVMIVIAVFELCAFLHGGKLICLQHDTCAIGRLVEIIPVGQDKSGLENMDDDFTMNIVLSPHSPTETLAEVIAADAGQGQARFVQEHPDPKSLGLPYEGESTPFKNIDNTGELGEPEVLHLEVKGCRVHDVCLALKVMSFGAPIVGAICTIPVLGWVACLVALAIWLVVTAIVAGIVWAVTHNGDINDVYDPAAGELVAADKDTGIGGDIILVRGDWAYDAGHGGWNEIHPARHVQKLTDVVDPKFTGMGKATPELVAEFKKAVLDVWCFHVSQGEDPAVIAAQDAPPNDWHIHPTIDGCDDYEPPVIK